MKSAEDYKSRIQRAEKRRNEKRDMKGEKMKNNVPFCTCTDLACPCHPSNHDKGCAPCIARNLERKEIPACFFKKVDPDERPPAYGFEDFAEFVIRKRNDNDTP